MPSPKKATGSLKPASAEVWPVAIGEAARRSGVSPRMLRHYEALGLLSEVARSDGGYRLYSAAEVHNLRFIRRARDLGFAIEEIRRLLGLWQNQSRTSAQVRQIAEQHIASLAERIAAMQSMQRSLQALVGGCHGDGRPDCPILDDLASLEDSPA